MSKRLTKKDIAGIVAPEGRSIIAVISGYWARAKTADEALKTVRKNRRGGKVIFFEVHERTQISDIGTFVYFPPEGRRWDSATEAERKEWVLTEELGVYGR